DNNLAGSGQALQPGGEIRSLADDRSFQRRCFADQISHDNQSGGDPDARLELKGPCVEAIDIVSQAQTRPDRLLSIVLMRSRVAKIGEHAVAHIPGDKAVELVNYFGDGSL